MVALLETKIGHILAVSSWFLGMKEVWNTKMISLTLRRNLAEVIFKFHSTLFDFLYNFTDTSNSIEVDRRSVELLTSNVCEITYLTISFITYFWTVVFDPCSNFKCHNGGTCESTYNEQRCICPAPWEGPTCLRKKSIGIYFLSIFWTLYWNVYCLPHLRFLQLESKWIWSW